jgi:hypothetical protein
MVWNDKEEGNLKSQAKCMLYKTDTNGRECWTVSKKDGNKLRILERKMLRTVYVPLNDSGMWRTRYNNELHTFCGETERMNVIKIGKTEVVGTPL